MSQLSSKKRGLVARLQALPEATRRQLAATTVATLSIIIVIIWLVIPRQTPSVEGSNDWRALTQNITTAWQESKGTVDELQKKLSEVKSLWSALDPTEKNKQALLEQYTSDWLTHRDQKNNFLFKYPPDARLATSTDPELISVIGTDGATWIQFTTPATDTPTTGQQSSTTITIVDVVQNTTTALIIETFQSLPKNL